MKRKVMNVLGATSLVTALLAIITLIGAFIGQIWIIVATIYRLDHVNVGYLHIIFHGLLWFVLWCVIQSAAGIVLAVASVGA